MKHAIAIIALLTATTASAGHLWGPCRCHHHAVPEISQELIERGYMWLD